jgi:hypothetical protein
MQGMLPLLLMLPALRQPTSNMVDGLQTTCCGLYTVHQGHLHATLHVPPSKPAHQHTHQTAQPTCCEQQCSLSGMDSPQPAKAVRHQGVSRGSGGGVSVFQTVLTQASQQPTVCKSPVPYSSCPPLTMSHCAFLVHLGPDWLTTHHTSRTACTIV